MIDPPGEILHTKDLFTREGNYLVFRFDIHGICAHVPATGLSKLTTQQYLGSTSANS